MIHDFNIFSRKTAGRWHLITETLVAFEQAIRREKLRAGSGCLSVNVCMDGSIKTARIHDVKLSEPIVLSLDPSRKHVSNTREI